MTRACVDAIRDVTDYRNFEIVLVDNWSTSDEALAFADEIARESGIRVIRVPESFNYSRLNNLAAGQTEGEFLLFLNNDVFVKQGSWLRQMVGEALADPRVGIVGAKLLYPNGLVQHGGIVLGVGGVGDHAHRGLAADDPGYMARAICAQNLSAVTAACMLCRREAFERVGRFDEVDLAVAFNDVDLCLKEGAAGYRIVWTPGVVAEHRESLSRGNDFKPDHLTRFLHENKVMEERWGHILGADMYYNPHFSRRTGIFSNLGGTRGTLDTAVTFSLEE
jgi:GT2 family glycosyltransferase